MLENGAKITFLFQQAMGSGKGKGSGEKETVSTDPNIP